MQSFFHSLTLATIKGTEIKIEGERARKSKDKENNEEEEEEEEKEKEKEEEEEEKEEEKMFESILQAIKTQLNKNECEGERN
jgi:hypothetical protein